MVDNQFNQCKSPLKYLQYSAVGLPSICSNVTPYKELIQSGVNGFLVDNTVEKWQEAIINILYKTETLNEVSLTAKKFVIDHYGMSNYMERYVNIFRQLLIVD